MSSNYTVDNIQIVSDLGHIRLRAGMYVGDQSNPYQLFNEAIDNSVDEFLHNKTKPIEIKINTTLNIYSVRDYGRGIPIGNVKLPDGTEVPSLVALATKSFSSGKFNNDAYGFKSGLHGVGLKCINALSSYFKISTIRDGVILSVISSQGNTSQIINEKTKEDNGVLIKFTPDSEMFESNIIPIDMIIERVRTLSAFGVGINLYIDNNLIDIRESTVESLLPSDNETYFSIPIDVSTSTQKMIVRINYSNLTSDRFFGYTNLLYNKDGGTHVRLIRKSIQNVWKKFYPKDTKLLLSDCLVGLDCLVAVFLPNTSFDGQVKDRLGIANSILSELMEKFEQVLYEYLISNKELVNGLLDRFLQYRISQSNLLDQKTILDIIKIDESIKTTGVVSRKSVVPELLECTSKSVEGTCLYLVEGKSAGGPAGRVRDRRTQAVLPLRGKLNNTTGMTSSEALQCQMIEKIVNSTGCGFANYIDISTCRYEKIIILADADADGKHISSLIITLFINHMPELVKSGKVFVLEPPLYGWKDKSGFQFTSTLEDIPFKLRENKDYTRYKGLGEMDDEEFYESCFNVSNQKLKLLEYPKDVNQFNYIAGSSMGRRELLEDLNVLISINKEDLVNG